MVRRAWLATGLWKDKNAQELSEEVQFIGPVRPDLVHHSYTLTHLECKRAASLI